MPLGGSRVRGLLARSPRLLVVYTARSIRGNRRAPSNERADANAARNRRVSPPDRTPAPVADFGLSPADPTTSDDIRLDDFSYDPGGVGISSRSWDFDDGDASTKPSPRHRFDTGGTYDVRLTVTTFDGRETSIVRTVRVRPGQAARTRESSS